MHQAAPPNGARRTIGGKDCIFYDGYWIRYYPPPDDTLSARKSLIEHLSRRLFHHTEPGINTPGDKLDLARANFERETHPARRRVAAAMLAGALFNRATDIFQAVVDLQHRGVEISPNNELMRQCGQYFQEALELGKQVKHYSGHEGIDELWGEPFKAFTMPIDAFYESRYVKVALTMRDIDRITERLADSSIFEVWPQYVATSEAVREFRPALPQDASLARRERADAGRRLVRDGHDLLGYLGGARVPMPKSTAEYLAACDAYRDGRPGG